MNQWLCRQLPTLALIPSFLFTWTSLAQGQDKCVAFTLKVSLPAGQNYEKQIGGGLTLRVRADTSRTEPNGWDYMIEDDLLGRDYIAPVNPPLRFNPSQMLAPGYGLSARESLSMNREVRFILKKADYDQILPLWEGALWPYSAPVPDNAAGNYIGAISRAQTGVLQVKTLESDISPEDKIHSAVFEFRLILPEDFPVNPAFKNESVGCPAKFK